MQKESNISLPPVSASLLACSIAIAAALWFVTFHLSWGNFWVKISISAGLLCAVTLIYGQQQINWSLRPADLLISPNIS